MLKLDHLSDRPERQPERELDFIDIPDWPTPDPEKWAEYLEEICSKEEIGSVHRDIDQLSTGERRLVNQSPERARKEQQR